MNDYATNRDFSIAGEIIGDRYLLVKRLGSGAMGDVYLAHDRNVMNRETVIKILKTETLANQEIVRKFKHEIEALARLKDPGIVTILDSGTHGNQPFLALEYIEGEDLELIISPFLFSSRDFFNAERFAEKLCDRVSIAADIIWKKLSPEAQILFSGDPSKNDPAPVLRAEFNQLLADQKLSQSELLKIAKSRPDFAIPEKIESYNALMKFNRSLLENVFPDEIKRGKDKKLSAAEAAVLFRQLGESLTHGHRRGIIHRDLKPANIMIAKNERGEWQTKLIDFGVAKVRESLAAPSTEIGLSFGTQKYMSPEQINWHNDLSPAADIYALGLIAFESLTGRYIFPADNFIEYCRMQEEESFSELNDFRPDLSPRVKEIICRALSYNPENRQQSAEEFGTTLAESLYSEKTDVSTSINNDDEIETVLHALKNRQVENKHVSHNASKIIIAAGALAMIIFTGFTGWMILRNFQQTPAVVDSNANRTTDTVKINRELNYKLIVQKYYEGKPFQESFDATGDEIFGDEWRFRMIFDSPQNGNLYLLTENPKTENLTMLFPHPQKNGGESKIAANEKIETSEMAFDKNQGTEKFWIIWSEKPVAELEAVKTYVNPKDLGVIKDSGKENSVRKFLDKVTAQEKLIEKIADNKQSKNLQTTNDILVKAAEFRHN